MKVLGFMPLHYGKEYLREALMSVNPLIEKMVIAYSSKPSYGSGADIECPDKADDLFRIAARVLGDKLIWVEKTFSNEGEHRNVKYEYSEGFDLILSVDADEVYNTDECLLALKEAFKDKEHRRFGIDGFIHFWKSFRWCNRDGFRPIRIENLHNRDGQRLDLKCTIYHFGYAQNTDMILYKWTCHGHQSELKPGWLVDFMEWTPEHERLHPCSNDVWIKAERFDRNTLPLMLRQHKNFEKEIIE